MVQDYEFMFNMLNETLAPLFRYAVSFVHHTELLFSILNAVPCNLRLLVQGPENLPLEPVVTMTPTHTA